MQQKLLIKKEVDKNMNKNNDNLSKYACKNEEAIRMNTLNNDFRPPFFRDIDKIIYSLSYTRYIDKTQVFSNIKNDMISKRIIHIHMVSKIARTIGRALNLNEDLIEAAGLGHDLGHVPFGHVGEKILNKLSLKYNEGFFNHNVQSVRILMNIENNGYGNNITIQVLDAILCHNGEVLKQIYYPSKKTLDEFIYQYNSSYKIDHFFKDIRPMTLEGCVVKISDIIAYVGKDIEDAARIGKIKMSDIPKSITNILGNNNSEIVNTIVVDIINNSMNKNYIKLSDDVFNALQNLINFNYENIYLKANTNEKLQTIEKMFNDLFKLYYDQICKNEKDENIYTVFLNEISDQYLKNTSIARKVIDYIAGMTDDYFNNEYKKYFG